MKRIKNIISATAAVVALVAAAFVLASCDDKLDIVPKGKVTLATAEELELMLNQEYMIQMMPCNDAEILSGESLGFYDNVHAVLAQTNTLKYAYMTFDESVGRAMLTSNDERYNSIYRYINYMNVVIEKSASAKGDKRLIEQISAEAKVMRAYMHWLAVCYYAQQYDGATAASVSGVPYVTNTKVTEKKVCLNLADTYAHILADVADDIIEALPLKSDAPAIRGDRAWGYAVRAVVLMQMKRYSEALPYAKKAIELHPQMFDRSVVKATGSWEQRQDSENNFIFIGHGPKISPTMVMVPADVMAMFEDGDYVLKYDSPGWDKNQGESMSGIEGTCIYYGWGTMLNVYGLTSELLHYVAAECLIRTGKAQQGLDLVNDVREKRVENCKPFTADNEAEAMALLQKAKYVECIGSTFNFIDIKRWNTEPAYKRTIVRRLKGIGTYRLAPESKLWVFPFPSNATRYNDTLKN